MRLYPATSIMVFSLLMVFQEVVVAQEVYTSTWTIQDPESRLKQQFVERIIVQLNHWVTRNNPEAMTARLDDRVQITVQGTYRPERGEVLPHVIRIRAGNVVVDDNPYLFLDSAVIDTILRRDYYWRTETVEVTDASLLPEYYAVRNSIGSSDTTLSYEETFFRTESGVVASLDHLHVRASRWIMYPDLNVGLEKTGMAFTSYGRVRIGIGTDRFRGWYEAPLPVKSGSGILSTANSPAQGLGVSFSVPYFSATATISDPYSTGIDSGVTAYVMTKSLSTSLEYPFEMKSGPFSYMRIQLGAEVLETTSLQSRGEELRPLVVSSGMVRPTFRAEAISRTRTGELVRDLWLESNGVNVGLGGFVRLSPLLGIKGAVQVRGVLISNRELFESPLTLLLTPVIYLNPL